MAKALLALLAIAYPLLIYFGLSAFSPATFAFGLAVLWLLRLGVAGSGERRWLLIPLLGLIAYGIVAGVANSEMMLRAYPVVVNAALLGVFAWTLIHPPSLIERAVRAAGMEVGPAGPPYLTRLTLVWCCFFVLNGVIAAWTLALPLKWWALYNGLLSYIAIAIIMGVEILVRRRYKRKHGEL